MNHASTKPQPSEKRLRRIVENQRLLARPSSGQLRTSATVVKKNGGTPFRSEEARFRPRRLH
jgi:hypothetical protein